MDQGAIEGAMDGASSGSRSNIRSDGWCKGWIMEQKKERWMVQGMDQEEIEGAMVIRIDNGHTPSIVLCKKSLGDGDHCQPQ